MWIESDIEIMANYIFGLPGDTINTMQKTFDLSMDLCTVGWNAYAAMALPGSQLYKNAIENNISLWEYGSERQIYTKQELVSYIKNSNIFTPSYLYLCLDCCVYNLQLHCLLST